MFRGNYPARVDEKGRLKVPADFKHLLDEQNDSRFYITSKDGRRAEVHPLPHWEGIEQKLAKIPDMNPAKKKYMDRVNYYGQSAEFDGQARLLMPQILREAAKLTGDVLVIGKGLYFEVVNREAYVQEMELNPLTEQDARDLASFEL
jgi:MraZ protein